MPRAHRYFLPGYVWHITQRCHKQEFLLKFAKDRQRWLHWLFEARKRYDLCVLNYVVTSNHIHLLVKDTGQDNIPASLQLMEGRTAQEYNRRKGRKGAYWEDRYHATAVETDEHFTRCITYIDLNMVRAGVVTHPKYWPQGGYREIQSPPERYRIIDLTCLMELCGMSNLVKFQQRHRQWVDEELRRGKPKRDGGWSQSIALGSDAFVRKVQDALGLKARDRVVTNVNDKFELKETAARYSTKNDPEKEHLSAKNALKWNMF